MSGQPTSEFPLWFPFAFLGLWLLVSTILSELSGWRRLADRFAAGSRPAGQRLRRQVTGVGLTGENGVTGLIVTPEGLYLYAHPLFRFRRPPVLVPWPEVRYVGERRMLWRRTRVLDLGAITTVTVKQEAYAAIEPYISRRIGVPAA